MKQKKKTGPVPKPKVKKIPLVLAAEQRVRFAELVREKSRRNLLCFTRYTKRDYDDGWFHREICAKLDKFISDVAAGVSPRMMIFAPRRHGKTELASRRLPAFVLGRYPDMKIMAASYGSTLAGEINKEVQRIIDGERYHHLFPGTVLSGSGVRDINAVRTSESFDVVGRNGSYSCSGVGGGMTGKGGQLMILDDPFKDAEEAYSETVRKSKWEWFQSVFYTCCEPGAGILIINTRWHEDDIAGRLLANMKKGGEKWEVLSYPAIAEEDQQYRTSGDLRECGEALCPERYNLEALERIRRGTEDEPGVGSRMWNSLYQQRPSAKEGGSFKLADWQFMKFPRDLDPMESRDRRKYLNSLGITKIVQTWDTAIGGKEKNDFAACTTMGVAKNKYVTLEVWQKKITYPEMRRAVQTQYDKWLPDAVGIEGGGAAAGKVVIQDLKGETRIPFHEIITSKDKELRADLLSPIHEAHLCYLPEGAHWVADFIDHCTKFPSLKHDDDVDSWMLALEFAESAPKPMHISDETLAAFGVA